MSKTVFLIFIVCFLGLDLKSQSSESFEEGSTLYLAVIVERDIKLLHYEFYVLLEDSLISFPDIEASPVFVKNTDLENFKALDELNKKIFEEVERDNDNVIVLDQNRDCHIYKFDVPFYYRIESGLVNSENQLVIYDANYKDLKRVDVDSRGLVEILSDIMHSR